MAEVRSPTWPRHRRIRLQLRFHTFTVAPWDRQTAVLGLDQTDKFDESRQEPDVLRDERAPRRAVPGDPPQEPGFSGEGPTKGGAIWFDLWPRHVLLHFLNKGLLDICLRFLEGNPLEFGGDCRGASKRVVSCQKAE